MVHGAAVGVVDRYAVYEKFDLPFFLGSPEDDGPGPGRFDGEFDAGDKGKGFIDRVDAVLPEIFTVKDRDKCRCIVDVEFGFGRDIADLFKPFHQVHLKFVHP